MKTYLVNYFELSSDEKLAYYHSEPGKPIVFLIHGNFSSTVHWFRTMEVLEDDYSVYAVDLRGFGLSSYRHSFDSLAELALDLVEFILKQDLQDISLIGWSLGGGVAMELAAACPERIKNLTLYSSIGSQGMPMYEVDTTTLQPLLDKPLHTKDDLLNHPVYVAPIDKLIHFGNYEQISGVLQNLYCKHQPLKEEMDLFVEALQQQRNLVDAKFALLSYNITDQHNGVFAGSSHIKNIKCPVLMLHGDRDSVIPIEESCKTKKIFQEQAKFIEFEGCGHGVHIDEPEKWLYEVREFIKKHQ